MAFDTVIGASPSAEPSEVPVLPGSVLDVLQTQYSLIARHQVRARCSPAERRRCRRSTELAPAGPRVLRHLAGTPALGQQLLLPVLDAGPYAVLWGYAAMQWWGFGRFRSFPVDVARPPMTMRPDHLGRIHSTDTLEPGLDVTTHRGIPIARPERLILWVARELTYRWGHDIGAVRLERTLDHAWPEGLIDPAVLHHLATRRSGKGNAGIVILRTLLEDRPLDHRPTDSNLEKRWEEVVGPLARQFRRQVVLGGAAPIGRFDQVHVDRPLVVEINGEKHHTMPTDITRDEERYQQLLAAGFSVVVYWQHDIWHDAPIVRSSLAQILARPNGPPAIHRPTPAPFQLVAGGA